MNQDVIEQAAAKIDSPPIPIPQFEEASQAEVSCEIAALGRKAFKKALASLIMSPFPITSAIAILNSKRALKLSKRASKMAEESGVSAGGKVIASKIISIIARVLSIICTCFYLYYLIQFILIVSQINQIYQIASWIIKIAKIIFRF